VFPAASYQYVLYGMGFVTQASHLGLSEKSQKMADSLFNKNIAQTNKLTKSLPKNRELLNKIRQYGLQTI
jgi:hypothetical protein